MKLAAASRAFFNWKPPPLSLPSTPLGTRRFETSTSTTTIASLTEEELKQINDIVPRLCSSNHLREAIQLISAALSAPHPPPLSSLPLSTLVNRLSLEPDLTHPMHLLNALKHSNPNPEKTLTVANMLVSHFFRNGHPKRAAKIFQWATKPDFPGGPTDDLEFYGVVVDGLCRNGMVLDCLRVVRAMAASEKVVIGSDVSMRVYRGLLREARVKEALELDEALDRCALGSDGDTLGSKELVDLLDRMITNWVD